MEIEKPLQGESFVTVCLTDEAENENWASTFETNLPSEECLLRAASIQRYGVQELSKNSFVSSCASDLECGLEDVNVMVENSHKNCRICSFSSSSSLPDLGKLVALGCSCKGELAFAHQKCAETWFNIKGNRCCEICGSKVRNLTGYGVIEPTEKKIESSNDSTAATERFCQGYKLIGSVLSSIVVIIIICLLRNKIKKL